MVPLSVGHRDGVHEAVESDYSHCLESLEAPPTILASLPLRKTNACNPLQLVRQSEGLCRAFDVPETPGVAQDASPEAGDHCPQPGRVGVGHEDVPVALLSSDRARLRFGVARPVDWPGVGIGPCTGPLATGGGTRF